MCIGAHANGVWMGPKCKRQRSPFRHFYEIVHTTVLDPFDLHTTVPLRAAHPNRERAEIKKTLPRERERLHEKRKNSVVILILS